MSSFLELSTTEQNPHHKEIFALLANRESNELTKDGASEIVLDSSELLTIRSELSAIVQENRANETQSLESFIKNLKPNISKLVTDGFKNDVSGIGTPIDPAFSTEALVPISILPQEASAYYSNGGIPARIIDKKAGCLALNGVKFDCAEFKLEDIQTLEDYADSCGFSQAYLESESLALQFGGAVTYPVLTDDTPFNFGESMIEIKKRIAGRKHFIRHWVTVDRWNTVFVPDYNITAQDYLFAKTLFIPLGGVRVNTQRMAVVRPKKLPFWAAIQQMGWSTSDFEGWIKDYEAYKIMIMSLPIMAQQSSLMYHAIPADGLIIENGPGFAKQYFRENEEQMRKWSMLHPRAINSIGEIKILERTYSGYRDLVSETKLALCASSGVAESILFEEKATGLASDNREDVTLKQSEMIRLLFNNTAPSFKSCIELLVYSCFGFDSEQAKHADKVKIKADNGFVLSEIDKATIGSNFTQIASGFANMGASLKDAIIIAKSFTPSVEIDKKVLDRLASGENDNIDSELWELINAGRK